MKIEPKCILIFLLLISVLCACNKAYLPNNEFRFLSGIDIKKIEGVYEDWSEKRSLWNSIKENNQIKSIKEKKYLIKIEHKNKNQIKFILIDNGNSIDSCFHKVSYKNGMIRIKSDKDVRAKAAFGLVWTINRVNTFLAMNNNDNIYSFRNSGGTMFFLIIPFMASGSNEPRGKMEHRKIQ